MRAIHNKPLIDREEALRSDRQAAHLQLVTKRIASLLGPEESVGWPVRVGNDIVLPITLE
jgi:hypothetical protein